MILKDVWETTASTVTRDFYLVQWYAQRKGKKPTHFSDHWEDIPKKIQKSKAIVKHSNER